MHAELCHIILKSELDSGGGAQYKY